MENVLDEPVMIFLLSNVSLMSSLFIQIIHTAPQFAHSKMRSSHIANNTEKSLSLALYIIHATITS